MLKLPSRSLRGADRPPAFVAKYYLYRATAAASFTMPIWYLYLTVTTGSYGLAAAANAIWWAGLVLFEIPTGYVGDRLGRRRALILGTAISVAAMASMAFVDSFAQIAVVFVAWSLGSTFRSGTADAWLYETLDDRLDGAEFARVRGRGGTVAAVTTGVTALAGGYLSSGSMGTAYLASAALVALGIPVLWSLPDAPVDDEAFTVLDALPVLRSQFSTPPLRAFVLLFALYSGVHWGVNFFIQPLGVDLGLSQAQLGWLFAGFTVVSGTVSYFAGTIQERLGVRRWFTLVPLVLGVAFVGVVAVPLLALPVFVLMRAMRGAALPLANQFVNDHAGSVGRATVLSTAGMVYSLVTIPFELGAGSLADVLGPVTTIGLFGGLLLVGSTVVLLAGTPFSTPTGAVADPAD